MPGYICDSVLTLQALFSSNGATQLDFDSTCNAQITQQVSQNLHLAAAISQQHTFRAATAVGSPPDSSTTVQPSPEEAVIAARHSRASNIADASPSLVLLPPPPPGVSGHATIAERPLLRSTWRVQGTVIDAGIL